MIQWNGRTIEAILFDMDGVIADTRLAHMETWGIFAREEGIAFDGDDWIRRTFGRGNNEILPEIFPERNLTQPQIDALAERKEEMFRQLFRAGGVPAVPGLHACLEALRGRGVRLAVGSSAPPKNVTCVLEVLGIGGYFEVIVSSGDVARSKPWPDIFLRCAELLQLEPKNCLVLEDSLHGLEAAHRAGCPAVGFATMHTHDELNPHAEAVVDDFVGLAKTLSLA
ncbi:beta-phosphoglucomutase family hydrolase [bacterium]|nr:beta-phosphoglucomutase family hydrolase [bacterium]